MTRPTQTSPMQARPAQTRPLPPTRESVRRSIADELLEALDGLVARHRALALHGDEGGEYIELHAELIAAEVAHQLAITRSALRRHRPVPRAS